MKNVARINIDEYGKDVEAAISLIISRLDDYFKGQRREANLKDVLLRLSGIVNGVIDWIDEHEEKTEGGGKPNEI